LSGYLTFCRELKLEKWEFCSSLDISKTDNSIQHEYKRLTPFLNYLSFVVLARNKIHSDFIKKLTRCDDQTFYSFPNIRTYSNHYHATDMIIKIIVLRVIHQEIQNIGCWMTIIYFYSSSRKLYWEYRSTF